ncbi:stAR-related lipid transfer protein 9 isoform X3 [Anolis sagrei]|uniref:stAR-related lipid transfer protein 9 isoform X3 n=2 Tax=Anolis sagrei TaxID=38937 RepID=UPI003520ED06
MANVKVAVRVRPLSKREHAEGRQIIVEVEDKVAKIRNIKVDNRHESLWDTKERIVAFGFDYCYWSIDPEDSKYASQEVVFQDLGTSVLSGAFKGYNICLFAYGQTGSGKTYTMMGTPASIGLTPRICEGLFSREDDYTKESASCRVEISFLEIYNERVRDLLKQTDHKKPYTLRVREHPVMGPYVQGLSKHVVTDYKQVVGLLEAGIANRITAATHVHDASSRSHAIFTIQYTQAILYNNLPSEITSKINLVDLAGSERADPSYCKDRITEGANINKSLVTLGIVISSLAQNSQMFCSCQSINSIGSEVDSNHTDNHCGASISSNRRQAYIPYRDSILTWLLKDSLGGNSKTIMIATISPASSCYNETMSTLRYASNAKNIINKPRVNEDANVKLIRELREEIDRLKAMLMSFELRNASPSWSDDKEGNLTELVLQNEIKIEQLTKDWTDKWINKKAIMEEYSVDINKKKAGVVIDSSLPHLMAMDDDILSTGVVLYHLREGRTKIGRSDSNQEQDIVLQGQWIKKDHCVVDNQHGIVTLQPLQEAHCIVNGHEVTDSIRLSQGAVIILGKAHKFRFNHPAEAAILRQRRSVSESSVVNCRSLEWLDLDGNFPSLSYSFSPPEIKSSEQREAVHEECQQTRKNQEILQKREILQQQLYVEELQQQILDGEIKAAQELEHDQAVINQQIKETQQWLVDEKKRLTSQQHREFAVQTEVKSYAEAGIQNILESEIVPSVTEQNRKKLVQLELLRKYSLKKAERHLSRKKVKLHLERIVKKQKLLEAKKNLEQLEATCWSSEDNVKPSQSLNQDSTDTCWDCKYSHPKSKSYSLKCRCDAPILNLQLPHCSLFLKRNPSRLSTSATSYGCSKAHSLRKSLSIEYLPKTLKNLSRRDNIHDEKDDSFTTQKQIIKNQKILYFGNKEIVGKNSTNTEILSLISKDNQTMEKANNRPRQTRTKTQIPKNSSPDLFKRKCEPEAAKQGSKAKTSGDSNRHSEKYLEKSEALEGSRKYRREKRKKHQSSLSGNSTKELKKSTVSEKPPLQHLSQTSKNVKRNTKDSSSVEQPQILKVATSASSLTNISTSTSLGHGEKRWHSAEMLSVGISKGVHGPLRSWQEDEDTEFSDTDSNYSVDSLSCGNAKILTDALTREEESIEMEVVNLEDSESDDSQMSQDSLTEKINKTESENVKHFPEVHKEETKFQKENDVKPLSLMPNTSLSSSNLTMNERSFSLDSLGDVDDVSGEEVTEESKLESFDEVPAEHFWKMQNLCSESIKSNRQHNLEQSNETVIADDLNLNTSSFFLDASAQPSSSNICDQSIREVKINFSEQAGLLDQRSHVTGENLPVLPDAWLSCDMKNGKSSPIIAMPSSQDHTEFRVAQLHPANKPWMKREDLRQSAAELSFVSCYEKPYRVSHEPNNIEMLLSSATPSVPLPETRKYLEIEAPGAISSFSLSTFSKKHSYCEVASSLKSVGQQSNDFSENKSADEWKQTSSCLKETPRTNSSLQVSLSQGISVSSVYPAISKDEDLKNNSMISASSQKGETYLNTNFEECLFRTIEKEDDSASHSTKDAKIIELNHEEKLFSPLPDGFSDLTSGLSPKGSYKDHEHLFSNDKTTLISDESFYLSDILGKHTNSITQLYMMRYDESNIEVVQKTKCQQLYADNPLYDTETTAFQHSDQLPLPVETSETEKVSIQENRDVLTESALEVPSFREAEEVKDQCEEWCLENDFRFHTEPLLTNSCVGLKAGSSGNSFSQEKESSDLCVFFNESGCSRAELHSDQARNYNEKNSGKVLGKDGVASTMASQEHDLSMNKESGYEKEGVVSRALTACEDRKSEHNCKTINSEELTKLINSVNKLECDILEMKNNQNKCLRNFLRVESQSLNADNTGTSENDNLVQTDGDHEKDVTNLLTVTHEEIDKERIQLINVNKEKSCASKTAIEMDKNIEATSVNCHEIQGNSTESSCLGDIKTDPESTSPNVFSNSIVLTHTVVDFVDTCEEPVPIAQTLENALCYESRAAAVSTECRQDNTSKSSEEDKTKSITNETSLIESLMTNPETAQEKNVDRVNTDSQSLDVERNVAAKHEKCVKSELIELHTDKNVDLFQENPGHLFMNPDNDIKRTNQCDTESQKIDFTASNLEEKQGVPQLVEAACLHAEEAYGHQRSASICTHMESIDETLKDNSNDSGSDDYRAVTTQCRTSEEFKAVENINTYKSSCTDYLANTMSKHSDLNVAEVDIYKCLPSNYVPKEERAIHPKMQVKLATTEILGQSVNAQSSCTFKTENNGENLKENGENLENKCSNSFSNNAIMLTEVLKEDEWVPHIFPQNNASIIDDSILTGHMDPAQITNKDGDISSVAFKNFPSPLAYSPSFPEINTNGGNRKRSSPLPSSPAVQSSNHISSEILLQYYETHMDSGLEAEVLCANTVEINDSSNIITQNKYVTFLPDQMSKGKEHLASEIGTFTTPEQSPVKDDKCSKSCATEFHESLAFADIIQNETVALRKLLSAGSTSSEMGRSHSEYNRGEQRQSEECLTTLNIYQKENARSDCLISGKTVPPLIFGENNEDIISSLPELSTQDCFNSVMSQKELNLLQQYDQTQKCLDNCTEAECKRKSETFTGELESQAETTEILVSEHFLDLSEGHSSDTGATSEDRVNISRHSDQALWENARYGEGSASGYNMNSYISEYSASRYDSLTSLPHFLLKHRIDEYNADDLYFEESKYLGPQNVDVPVCTVGVCAAQQDSKITSHADCTKNIQTSIVLKNVSSLESSTSPDFVTSSICRPYIDSQDAFLTPSFSTSFRGPESQVISDTPGLSSETSHSYDMSETERHTSLYAATASSPSLATCQMQESQCDNFDILDQQLCASETTSFSITNENRCLPLCDAEGNSQRNSSSDSSVKCTFKSEQIFQESGVHQEPRNRALLQKSFSEDFGRSLYGTLNSNNDTEGDQNISHVDYQSDVASVPTTNTDSNCAYEVLKNKTALFAATQPNISVINNSMSSKYLSGNSCLTFQEDPASERLGKDNVVLTSQNTKRSNDNRQRPGLHSHSLSAPTIVVMSNSEFASETSKADVSVHLASKSLQELNMSVQPPSPTEDNMHKIERVSKLKTGSVVPNKYKPRFQRKSIQAQHSSHCDKRNVRERILGSHSSDPSPVRYPIAVALTTDNPIDTEIGKCSNNANSIHGYNIDENERLRHQMEATDKLPQDNKDAMHFSSSDINPYIHPWQQDEPCKFGWKQYVFGSASDVSSKPPPLSLDNQMAMRCSSVDNGLNSQNSPFHSHLSSYANARILSSTISSTEDLQGWDIARDVFETAHSEESGKHFSNVSHDGLETTPKSCISHCENVIPDVRCSQQSGNTPMHVDEIVLLYPSKSEISPNKPHTILTCEQETQTEAPSKHKRQKRHRRSYTDISARKTDSSNSSVQHPSWSSVQNLSMHLSQLLHNTSELLGNFSLQTAKDNEHIGPKATEESTRGATSDSSTQTTKGIGIQTDIFGHFQNETKERHINTNVESDPVKYQEVNVIVKLMHSDTKERTPESTGRILQSMPDIRSYHIDTPEDSCKSAPRKNSSLPSEVPKIPVNVPPALVLGSPQNSPIVSSSKHDSTLADCSASTLSLSPPYYSQDKRLAAQSSSAEARELFSKKSLLVDRASSPILTLSASTINHQALADKSTCSFRGSVGQQMDTVNSQTSFIKKGVGPHYSLNSWESLVDTSSQTEAESESTTSRESNEMCRISRRVLDDNRVQELDSKSLDNSKQNHRFTINTHTAVHTKRLYHSSSTLELSSHGDYLVDDHRETIPVGHSFCQIQRIRDGLNYDNLTRNSESSPVKKSIRKSLSEQHTPSLLKSDWATDCTFDSFSPLNKRNKKCPFTVSEMSDKQDNVDDDTDTRSDTESECNTEILLGENTSLMKTQRLRSYSLRDLPLHNKFSNWCGVKGDPHSSLITLTQSANDIHSQAERKAMSTRATETEERFLLSERRAREIERLRRERAQIMSGVHLEMNQPPLTVELTEAKLTYGIGETDAQLRILQSGVGEDLTAVPIKQQLYERHRKSIEILRKQREERLLSFRRSRSLSPQKHLSLLQTLDTNQRDLDLPSRRREYLQQLRRDVVENTRVQEPKTRIQHPSDIELLLRDYQRAREETKTEIARARDKLRERAEQEKRRIREQLHSQLHKEEAKLKTLASTSTLCTDSTLSLSSGPTSGYNSSNTAASATSIVGKQEDQISPEDIEQSREGGRGRSAVRNHQLYILEQWQKGSSCEIFPVASSTLERSSILSSLASSHRYSHSLNVSPSTFPASTMKEYEDLSKHVLANATAEVMAGCSNDLKNLYNGLATAGWKYQCVEKDVLVYYKGFSSCATKHGFLGAGVIKRPLPAVLCLLKDASKRHLFDKTVTSAQVYKKITSNIELVYVVSDVSLCYQKQPRDFCCLSVEAREENVCILAIQSVYEESMPHPCKEIVRGEILSSAWILEPDTVDGKDVTKVVYMIQVDLGPPAIPASLLSSVAKRQPLVIARLAHFLAS